MKQQLELMNMRFGEVMNKMAGLRTKVANFSDGSGRRGPADRKHVVR
jgi:hypothetical protein